MFCITINRLLKWILVENNLSFVTISVLMYSDDIWNASFIFFGKCYFRTSFRVSNMMLMEIILDKVGSTFQKKEGKDKWDSFKIVFCVEWEIKKLPAFICRKKEEKKLFSNIFIFLYFMCFFISLTRYTYHSFHNASIFENCLKWKFAPNCL